MKQEWGREEYINCCNSNERRGMTWWRLGIWKLRGSRKGVEKGTRPLCLGTEGTKHILLECPETKYWRMEMLCKRWMDINEEVAYRKILSCTNEMTVKKYGKILIQISMQMGKEGKKREFKENMESLVGYCNIVYKQTTVLKL
jgi:hypothetical protein